MEQVRLPSRTVAGSRAYRSTARGNSKKTCLFTLQNWCHSLEVMSHFVNKRKGPAAGVESDRTVASGSCMSVIFFCPFTNSL